MIPICLGLFCLYSITFRTAILRTGIEIEKVTTTIGNRFIKIFDHRFRDTVTLESYLEMLFNNVSMKWL